MVTDPADALKLLLEGNRRWVSGQLEHPHQTAARRLEVAAGQEPFALVFSCIDSRVPPEVVFDRGIGDLFVVRTGGQALDGVAVLGSIEFGPGEFASCRLIVVLGHQRCGAITAAVKAIQGGGTPPGHLEGVIEALRPAYDLAVTEPGDLVENMMRAQVQLTVTALREDPVLAALIAGQGLAIAGGRYDLDSGAVEIIA
jgi:carbonic anhydrase